MNRRTRKSAGVFAGARAVGAGLVLAVVLGAVCAPGLKRAAARAESAKASDEAQTTARNFEVQKLAEGVYAVVRKDLPGLMVDANNVFIINDEDVVVVDSNGAPSITREVLAALRKLTDKPVRYVVNTHYHDDHIRGNQVYKEAFPGVEFIGHAFARAYLPEQGATNRKGFLEGAPHFRDAMAAQLEKNKSLGGWDLTEEERASYQSDIRLINLVLSEGARAETILPTVTVEDRLTLYRGGREIDIMHLGNGHTAADLVVYLPKEGVLAAGDLVVAPVPLVGNPQSHVREWGATLEKIVALHPSVIVPGHGPVMRDDSYVRTLSEMFAYITKQTEAAVARGETLEQARRSVNLEEFRKRLAGESRVRQFAFSMYVAGPAVAAAFREASAAKSGGE
ncbi:MAG TPA: MBL fold metallo-hydrolase [Pyrinomonadaceae bacterium]|nr:MBL fold metallo-hydrolase [Pyrinomonadaceae bacterium]